MIGQIKCCECDKSEGCNRIGEYCWHEVELHAEKVKAEAIEKILDYVKTDRFISRWNEAKGEKFGDFLARVIKEDC